MLVKSWKLTGLILLFFVQIDCGDFVDEQKRYLRFREADKLYRDSLEQVFKEKSARFESPEICIRAYKLDQELEVWAEDVKGKLIKVFDFPFCAVFGILGPKLMEGDRQIPEGFYFIERFNPVSSYHLSLGINYPNQSDQFRVKKSSPGSDIFIHGKCVTIGCIPLGDEAISRLYLLAVLARDGGQEKIPVQIFPFRFNKKNWDLVEGRFGNTKIWKNFWKELEGIDRDFMKQPRIQKLSVTNDGKYYILE